MNNVDKVNKINLNSSKMNKYISMMNNDENNNVSIGKYLLKFIVFYAIISAILYFAFGIPIYQGQ